MSITVATDATGSATTPRIRRDSSLAHAKVTRVPSAFKVLSGDSTSSAGQPKVEIIPFDAQLVRVSSRPGDLLAIALNGGINNLSMLSTAASYFPFPISAGKPCGEDSKR